MALRYSTKTILSNAIDVRFPSVDEEWKDILAHMRRVLLLLLIVSDRIVHSTPFASDS